MAETRNGLPERGIYTWDEATKKYVPLPFSAGALVVTGAGASPSATALKISDGNGTTEADVLLGRLQVDIQALVETRLTEIRDYLDTVETKLQSIIDNTDTLESGIGVPGDAEVAVGNGSIVAILKNLRARIGNLETYTDGLEGLLTTIRDNADGVEGLLTTIRDNADTLETLTIDVKRAYTDQEIRLDYDTRVDGNPVYVGKALNGVLTSAATWHIQKFTYDITNRATRVQVLLNQIWDNRAILAW